MDSLAIVVVLLAAVVAVTLVLWRRGRASVLVFVVEVLAFWIYWLVLAVFNEILVAPIFVCSVLSVLTVYALLTYRAKRQLLVSRVREERASAE